MAEFLNSRAVTFSRHMMYGVFLLLFACSADLPKPEFAVVLYDYKIPSEFPLTSQHQYIAIVLDAQDIALPEFKISDITLPLTLTDNVKKAQIIVHINISESFLIQRSNGVRSEVVFPKDASGYVERYEVLRGFIRTHYSIEIIDTLTNRLIYDRQGAGNHGIETRYLQDKNKNIDGLKDVFFTETPVARYDLISSILKQLTADDFNVLRVQFKQDEFKVVKALKDEENFSIAFELLQENNQHQAKQALDIYNKMLKFYQDKPDEQSLAIMTWLEPGLTACTAIVNHPYIDRYPYQP